MGRQDDTPAEQLAIDIDWLRWMVDACVEPVVLVDAHHRIVLQNSRAESLFGAERAASELERLAVQRNVGEFAAALRGALEQQPAGGSTRNLHLLEPDDGSDVQFELRTLPAINHVDGTRGTVAVLRRAPESASQELERRRVEQMLFDSEKLAATGRLAASIAHEINNPLEAIKNALYLLTNKTADNDPNAKFLQIATKETDRVSRILRQMLGFYRPPRLAPTDVNRLIEESEALIEKHLRQNQIQLHNDLDPRLPSIVASADQIKQVLLNLMLNGQQAMPDGGTLFVSTRTAEGADPDLLVSESVQIQIRDTGHGIAEDLQPHIFEPFFSTKDEKGSGLGLWVSQGIVQAHGGSIKLRSRAGRGTVFSVALPISGPTGHGER